MSQKYFSVKNALIVMSVTYNQSSYVTKSIQMETHRNATIKFSTIVIIILLHNIFGMGRGHYLRQKGNFLSQSNTK